MLRPTGEIPSEVQESDMNIQELKQLQLLLEKYKKENNKHDDELEYGINCVLYDVKKDLEKK